MHLYSRRAMGCYLHYLQDSRRLALNHLKLQDQTAKLCYRYSLRIIVTLSRRLSTTPSRTLPPPTTADCRNRKKQAMAFVVKVPASAIHGRENRKSVNGFPRFSRFSSRNGRFSCPAVSMSSTPNLSLVRREEVSQKLGIPIMVNGCTGRMGKAVVEAAVSAGLHLVPVSFSPPEEAGNIVQVGGKEIQVYGPSERESILASTFNEYPDLVVVDYTVPTAVNDNAELYSRVGVPFVMGTTGGDRERLYKTVEDSNVYAVISPQMGKQVVAFLAAMEIMAEQFPGAFSGYSLQNNLLMCGIQNGTLVYSQATKTCGIFFPRLSTPKVMESHQAGKLDTSGTAKAVISCFQKLGVSFDVDEIQMVRDPRLQVQMVGVPEEHLAGHAFHMYHLTSPDQTVSFEFQHNVCGRSIYAEGTVDATIFLAQKVRMKAEKRIYNMIDVLREGNMR